MQMGHVTTPFGRRSMTLALVKGQLDVAGATQAAPVEKWRLFRDVCEARERFGLQDRALAVLDALLTFHPDNVLDPNKRLIVFPSNQQLSNRAHGITGTTLRRQLAALVDAGLIQRRDSPNGKRYAHRDREGEIEQAYGFDLTPLVARAAELAELAQDVVAERMRFRRAKEALTICRRDVRKLITAAMEEGASGRWAEIEAMYVDIIGRLPRYAIRVQVEATLDEMELLRTEVVNTLETQLKAANTDGSDIQNGCHIQNSKPESFNEFEPSSGTEQGETPRSKSDVRRVQKPKGKAIKSFPLGMVLRACPQVNDYGPGGSVSNWRDLMTAAVVVRSMLGVSPSAYEDACLVMGPENAATAMACILERSNFISSAGGYLRDLTKRSEQDEFSLGPMLMALLKANGGDGRLAG